MNERIRELIEQAHEQKPVIVLDPETCQPTHKIGNGGVPMYHSELNPEKFAELIVRECVDIAYEHDEPKMSGPGMIIAGRIEKHFGVEEQTIEQDQVPLPKNREQAMAMLRVATFYLDTQK